MRSAGSLTAIFIGIVVAIGVASSPNRAESQNLSTSAPAGSDVASSCDEAAYMFVMGGVEDLSALPDPERVARYGPAVWSLVESLGGRYIVRETPDTVYEGDWPEWKAVIISEWPCVETGRSFWNSDAYQNEVKPLRKDAGSYTVGMFPAGSLGAADGDTDLVPEACDDPYLIITLSTVTDTERYGNYGRAVRETRLARRAGFQYLFGGTPQEMLEGTWPDSTRLIAAVLPCKAAWEAFYLGEQYQSEVKPLREGAGRFVILGFTPERTP
jgi:uncharacterized protein (DUF1330 family)